MTNQPEGSVFTVAKGSVFTRRQGSVFTRRQGSVSAAVDSTRGGTMQIDDTPRVCGSVKRYGRPVAVTSFLDVGRSWLL